MKAQILDLTALYSGAVSYRIPQFQRAYAWKRVSQWEPLWADVKGIADSCLRVGLSDSVRPHFMGAIVLQPQGGNTGEVQKTLVVDGQQRLTTLQLLIKATEEAFRSLNDNDAADRLRTLTSNDRSQLAGDQDNDTKIRQSNRNDQAAFQLVIRTPNEDGLPSAIRDAYRYFYDEVMTWLRNGPQGDSARAFALERVLTRLVQIAAIDLDELEQPHIIFETLNERGEQLTPSDKIKNTVMYKANVVDDAKKARDLWGMFYDGWWRESTNEGRLTRTENDRFLNYWVIMKTGKDATSETMTTAFRNFLDEPPEVPIEEAAKEIRRSAVFYQRMESDQIPNMRTFLRRIKALEIGIVTPILMWLDAKDVQQERRARCHAVLESYLVRRMLCGFNTNGLNRYFQELLANLENPNTVDADLIERLRDQTIDTRVWPNDGAVREQLISQPLKGAAIRQRMVMEAIEGNLWSDFAEQILDEAHLTIEHIMPRTGRPEHWPLPSPSEDIPDPETLRSDAIGELGNLTLSGC